MAFQEPPSRRRVRLMASMALRVLAIVVVLVILFGQVGFALAGLIVVLKDFVAALLGRIALMGKSGLRVGDWAEIEGVGGEVLEIGLLNTTLVEVGNWTDSGHPAGRPVVFPNSFAFAGRYFNFSTSGLWVWDDLHVTIPPGDDPYQTPHVILEIVERATEDDANLATSNWDHVTRQPSCRRFSARPAVTLDLTRNGVEMTIRYLTRKPHQARVRALLQETVADFLHRRVSVRHTSTDLPAAVS